MLALLLDGLVDGWRVLHVLEFRRMEAELINDFITFFRATPRRNIEADVFRVWLDAVVMVAVANVIVLVGGGIRFTHFGYEFVFLVFCGCADDADRWRR